MPHPASMCVIAAQLLRRVWRVSFAKELPDIEAEHRGEVWQEAWDNYQTHMRACVVCKGALAVMDTVAGKTVVIEKELMR